MLAASVIACATVVVGCGVPVTWRPSSRALVAPPARALVIAISDVAAEAPFTVRILDENAEIVADVADGEHTVFEATPGEHVFAAFARNSASGLPGSPGALRATLAAGRIYAFLVQTELHTWQRRRFASLELTAISGEDVPSVLARLAVETRRELLPTEHRPDSADDDIDVREVVVGLAQLRIGGDEPRLKLLDSIGESGPPPHVWSSNRSTLAIDDGVVGLSYPRRQRSM